MSAPIATTAADALARWALSLRPAPAEREDALRQLVDVTACALAAAANPVVKTTAAEEPALRWAAAAHILGLDGVHLPTTTHIATVAAVAALAARGGEDAYLAGAGVMARFAAALGPGHNAAGWHATCTAGAIGAAAGAGVALGLDAAGLATAMALAVPGAGGTRHSFGTPGKALQVGFATAAGVRAARLVAAGARTAVAAVDGWLSLIGENRPLDLGTAVIPGGLLIKLHPCSIGLQRPIDAARELGVNADDIQGVVVSTPDSALSVLSEAQNRTSLGYGVAVALLDREVTSDSFAERPEVRALSRLVRSNSEPGGDGLMAGECRILAQLRDGSTKKVAVRVPHGHPELPVTIAEVAGKVADCLRLSELPGDDSLMVEVLDTDWARARELLQRYLG